VTIFRDYIVVVFEILFTSENNHPGNAIHYRQKRRDEVQMQPCDFSWDSADNFSIHFRPLRNREILRADGFRRKHRKYTIQEIRRHDNATTEMSPKRGYNVGRFQLKANYETGVK